MFRTAATKLAHNSTLPALAGNKDLRPLQDLITAEKAVLTSLQRLSLDIGKASEALKAWGLGEGDDLGDTLTASTALYLHFAAALSAFANHELSVREQMKSVRTREESLDELRRRRRALAAKADSAEKRLVKMKADNKNFQEQTAQLERLQNEIRIMDTDIMAEEASLGDYKRGTAKAWMGLKFGGLLECAQRGVIVGELGKLVIAEIPLEPTDPGLPRAMYAGRQRTEYLVATGQRAVNEVFFSPDPNPNAASRPIPPMPGFDVPQAMPMASQMQSSYDDYYAPGDAPLSRPTSVSITGSDRPPSNGSRFSQGRSPLNAGFSQPPLAVYNPDAPSSPPMPSVGETNEFGMMSGQYSPRMSSARGSDDREKVGGPRGARYATFPSNPIGGPRPLSTAYSSAQPLQGGERAPSLDVAREQDNFSSSVNQALETQWQSDGGPSQPANTTLAAPSGYPSDRKGIRRPSDSSQRSYEPPPPMYEPLPGLPPGAAPPQPPSGGGHTADEGLEVPGGNRRRDDDDDAGSDLQLAYNANESDISLGEGDTGDRRVRFEGSSAEEARHERDAAQENENAQVQERSNQESWRSPQPQHQSEPSTDSMPPRLPTPVQNDAELNAAAAREISREMDALMFSSPPLPPVPTDRSPSPLSPPLATFARRDLSPRPSVAIPAAMNSPGVGIQYTRERDRGLTSPTSPTSSGDHGSTGSKFSDDRGRGSLGSASVSTARTMSSPPPLNGGNAYRVSSDSATSPKISTSLYNLPSSLSGSGASFSTPSAGAPRTISAAAFRRTQQMRNASTPTLESPPSALPDTVPLQVKKRAMPASPLQDDGQSMPLSPSMGVPPSDRYRSVSATRPQNGASVRGSVPPLRPQSEHEEDEDEYDYISAYVNSPAGGQSEDERRGGYGQGRYSTTVGDGLR